MSTINKNDILYLHSGETCRVISLPGKFMSNGCYEVNKITQTLDGKYLDSKVKFWVKPNEISYTLTTDNQLNPITNYFETVYGENNEIYIIPKNLKDVELVVDEKGFKTIKLIYEDELECSVNILIGENTIKNIKND